MNQRKKYWGSKQAFERQNSSKRRLFLVAVTQLYKRLCPSIYPSVHRSVCNTRVEKWKNERFRWFFLGMCVSGAAWGVDGGWMPLSTHLQRYCDCVTCSSNYPKIHMFRVFFSQNSNLSLKYQ